MRNRFFVGICLLLLSGCAGIQKTGYLSDYDQLKKVDLYSKAYLSPAYQYDSKNSITVLAPKLAEGISLEAYQLQLFSDRLRQSFEDQIREKELFQIIPNGQPSDLTLETYIGKLNPGNGFLRWFLGLGFGQSDIQIESKLIQNTNQNQIGSYGYRRKDAGNAWFGLNMDEMDNEKQIQNAMGEVAKSFVNYLNKELK